MKNLSIFVANMYKTTTQNCAQYRAEEHAAEVAEKRRQALAIARKIKADKKAAIDFTTMANGLNIQGIQDEPKVIAVRKIYLTMSEEARNLEIVAGNKEAKVDGSLSKLIAAEEAIKQIKADIKLAHDREVSAKDRKIYLKAAAEKAIRTQNENLKAAALSGEFAETAEVVITLAPYIGIKFVKDEAKIEEAKKAKRKVYYNIDTTAMYFHNAPEAKKARVLLKTRIMEIVAKLTKKGMVTAEAVEQQIAKSYCKIGLFIIPAGGVFNIAKTNDGIKITIYTIDKWFDLSTEESFCVAFPIPTVEVVEEEDFGFEHLFDSEDVDENEEVDSDLTLEDIFGDLS